MSRRFGVTRASDGSLSPAQFAALMAEPIVATFATIDDEGYPHPVPIWFEWDGQAAWLVCRARAAFVQHLRRRPQASLLVARGDADQTRALLLGRASVEAGPAPLSADSRLAEIAERLAVRYSGALGRDYIAQSFEWPRVLVRFSPNRIISWGVVDWHPRYYRDG
jgi:PPOX class probable F420-dependent enzyme